jgi:hypothetical protein
MDVLGDISKVIKIVVLKIIRQGEQAPCWKGEGRKIVMDIALSIDQAIHRPIVMAMLWNIG